jgi:hypothetical protein
MAQEPYMRRGYIVQIAGWWQLGCNKALITTGDLNSAPNSHGSVDNWPRWFYIRPDRSSTETGRLG